MFTRAEFLQALEGQTTFDRLDLWALLAYLLVIGPVNLRTLRQIFWPVQTGGRFDDRLRFLLKHNALQLRPDPRGGAPLVTVTPVLVEIIQKVNAPVQFPAQTPKA